jgi:hypothetical protein
VFAVDIMWVVTADDGEVEVKRRSAHLVIGDACFTLVESSTICRVRVEGVDMRWANESYDKHKRLNN